MSPTTKAVIISTTDHKDTASSPRPAQLNELVFLATIEGRSNFICVGLSIPVPSMMHVR